LAVRDRLIGWDDEVRQKNLASVVNNSRFLVLPWLAIDGLASHILSLATRVLIDDWEEAYAVRPVLLETFVEQGRFEGTCYKAANWIEAGVTAKRGRMDRRHEAKERVKLCFVYPLVRDFRERLCAVEP